MFACFGIAYLTATSSAISIESGLSTVYQVLKCCYRAVEKRNALSNAVTLCDIHYQRAIPSPWNLCQNQAARV